MKKVAQTFLVIGMIFLLTGCFKKDESPAEEPSDTGAVEFDTGEGDVIVIDDGETVSPAPTEKTIKPKEDPVVIPPRKEPTTPTAPAATITPQSGPSMISILIAALLVGGISTVIFVFLKAKKKV